MSRRCADPFVEVFFKNFAENDAFVGETIVRKRTMEPSWEDQAPLELRVRCHANACLPPIQITVAPPPHTHTIDSSFSDTITATGALARVQGGWVATRVPRPGLGSDW